MTDREAMSLHAAQAIMDRLCRNDWVDHAPQGELLRGVARELRLAEDKFRQTVFNRKRRVVA